jgi:hydroxypyruvate reductase
MALAFLREMRSWSARQLDAVSFLAASTDGNDGPTDAAGAFADRQALDRASAAQLDMDAYLAANDSYHFFAAAQSLLRTGPTNTNVCDIQIILLH